MLEDFVDCVAGKIKLDEFVAGKRGLEEFVAGKEE